MIERPCVCTCLDFAYRFDKTKHYPDSGVPCQQCMRYLPNEIIAEALAFHLHVVGPELGDHRCSCAQWKWREGPPTHSQHLAAVVVDNLRAYHQAVWQKGYAVGYESPDREMDADHTYANPYRDDYELDFPRNQ